jgi:hypothetical protein
MAQVVYKDGSPVPPDKIATAIASGDAFTKGDKVTVRNHRTGEIGTIDPGDLAHSDHYSVLSDDELAAEANHAKYGTLGQQALTGVEGLARGATAGLSDVATTAILGDEYRKGAKARQTENPIAATGSEIAGAIAPALLTGGASAEAEGAAAAGEAATEGAGLLGRAAEYAPSNLIARAGSAVGKGVAGIVGESSESMLTRMAQRAAAAAASGAVEGGLYGAGQAASTAALDGTPITAEKVLSGLGHGALYGGGIGALGGAASGLGSSAFERLVGGSEGLREGAASLAQKSALDAVGFQGSDYRKLIGRKMGESAEARISDVGQELLDYTFDSGPLKGKKLFTAATKPEDFVDDLALAKDEVGRKLGAIKAATNDAALADPTILPDVNGYLGRVRSEVLDPLRASMVPAVRAQADKVEAELATLQTRMAPAADGLEAAPVTFNDLDRFRRDLRSVFQPPRPPGGGLPPPVPEHAVYLEKAERMLADDLDQAVEKHLAAAGGDTTEYLRNKKTYGALADIEKVANKATAQQLGNRSLSPSDYATGLGTSIGMMLTGNVGAMAAGGATSIAHKLIRERGRSVLAVMADSVAKMDGRISAAANSLAGLSEVPSRVALEVAPSMLDRFDHTSAAVRAFRDNPQLAADQMARPVEQIAPLHPQLAATMQQTIGNDYQYLAGKLPLVLSRSATSLTPQAEKSRVPKSEQIKFMSIVSALNDPAGVMARIAKGELPREQIDTLKACRPEIFNQMRTEAIKAFSKAKKPIGILKRTRVSLAFDFAGDASLDPATLALIQSSNRTSADPDDKPATPAPAARPQSAQLNPKNAADMSTPSQKAIGS